MAPQKALTPYEPARLIFNNNFRAAFPNPEPVSRFYLPANLPNQLSKQQIFVQHLEPPTFIAQPPVQNKPVQQIFKQVPANLPGPPPLPILPPNPYQAPKNAYLPPKNAYLPPTRAYLPPQNSLF